MSRKFGGKRFREHDIYGSKRNANKDADILRDKGYNARVVPEGRTYVLYKRRR